jgi:hypothetical protein
VQKANVMQIYFHISENLVNELTWEEYEAFEGAQDGKIKLSQLRPLIARFMVDEAQKPLPHAAAMKQLAVLPVAQIKDVFQKFSESLTGAAVPNVNGSSSKLPSEAAQPSESPAGSVT